MIHAWFHDFVQDQEPYPEMYSDRRAVGFYCGTKEVIFDLSGVVRFLEKEHD